MSRYFQDPTAQLAPSLQGLTLIQINPEVAVDLKNKSENFGWIFTKEENETWTKLRKLESLELVEVWEQVADMSILDASKMELKSDKKGWKKLFGK